MRPHSAAAVPATAAEILPLRTRHRAEMNAQIVHDSIHRREGWAKSYLLTLGDSAVGFASTAVSGPWKDKPTAYEFYVLPEHRHRAFALAEVFLTTSGARYFEAQSNESLASCVFLAQAKEIAIEKIVFADGVTTAHRVEGAQLRSVTAEEEIQAAQEERQGGGEWLLEVDGTVTGKGGMLFHYNVPFADLYMEINNECRRQGYGSFLVQELKRICYARGAVPCARCNPDNIASRRTLQRAGFVPDAQILIGSIRE